MFVPFFSTKTFVIVLLAMATQRAISSQNSDHSHHSNHSDHHSSELSQEAHTHGVATLLMVLDADNLNLEFRAPAVNVLGFEGSAKTIEQKARVGTIKSLLSKGGERFRLKNSSCQLLDHSIKLGTDSNLQEHNNVEIHYRFRCQSDHSEHAMATDIFKIFPTIDSLQVQWLVDDQQGSITVDHSQPLINIR